MKLLYRWAMWSLLAPIALGFLAACGGGSESTEATPPASATSPAAGDPRLQIALASTDLAVGLNRVAFGVIDSESGPLRDVAIKVSTYYLHSGVAEGPKETVDAVFRKWPVGAGGVYTTTVSFDRSGTWGIGVVVTQEDGSTRLSSVNLQVNERSVTPAIGAAAPRSVSRTSRDVDALDELTSDVEPDPDLYSMTIAEAIDSGDPLVVSFATPAFCRTATCGPQLDVVKELKRRYGDRANFIHVEIYDNLSEIEGDLSRARLAQTVAEWSLPTEPWTFIINEDGIVQAKFEAFATREELEEALQGVLR